MHGIRTGVIGATVLALGLAWGAPAIAANSAAPNAGSAISGAANASKPKVLLVGSYHGVSGDYTDIQSAVDAAKPGDWVLVGPGDYHERADYRHDGSATEAGGAVLVTTPGVHLRGMDRNAVVVDGTKPGAPKCSSAPSDQDLGPRDAVGASVGRNGVFVSKVDGVSIENLTACNFLDGRGGGNQIWFNGGDGSGTVGMGSFGGDYLTATTSYFQDGHPKGSYGIFASNAGGPGVIDHSYASNMSDSSYYIGACPDCQTTLIHAHAQSSALGYSGTNSGGRLMIVASEFDHNKTGISTNSQNNDDAPSPQDGACPAGVSTTSAIGSCTFFVLNNIHDNNNPNVPSSGSADLGPVGTGMVLAGGRHDTLAYNRVVNNGAWGLLLVPFPDTSSNPPPVANCAGGVDHPGDILGALGVTCFFDDFANEIVGNSMGNNGFFGNATNGDLADLSGQHDVGNCWHDNTNPAGVSSSPENLQATHATCGVPNAGADILSPLSLQVICDTEAFGPCATTPDQNYPRKTQTTLTPLPSQPTMPNPCIGVPRNRWCGDGDHRSDFVRNVLVPGESGALAPTTHSTDQIPLYDGLTPKFDQVSNDDLSTYFKDESMGDAGGNPETTPRGNGLRITRDSYGVPHIVGQTRFDTEFGAGWATAEDRGLVLETIRGPARVAALDVPGLDAFGLATSLRQFTPSQQTEDFIAQQAVGALAATGADGQQVLTDVDAYVAGINAYYAATGNPAAPWTRNDVLASTSLIGAVFGRGGGAEVRNSDVLAKLRAQLGDAAGTGVFRDLREAQDAEAPVTTTDTFNYDPVPTKATPGSAVIDAGSVQGLSALAPVRHMSNALLIGRHRTADHRAEAVMGPQVGYFYPEILMEMDLHGGGLDARGASFPGTSIYVELGRGKQFAWSATSSESDNTDQFLEQLCNIDGTPPTRDSRAYLYNGTCTPMTEFDAGVLRGANGQPDQEVVFQQTVHGPVAGTATVAGKPYAISTLRSTRGREPMNAIGFMAFNENRVKNANDFLTWASKIEYTFNWFYTDRSQQAYFSSGRLPKRAKGTDQSLPTIGTGQWDWQGFLSPDEHPHAIDPSSGSLFSWNNKPAPGFAAADDNWSFGAFQHVSLFQPFAANGVALNDIASVMNKAATADDRAVLVWPTVARVLAGSPAPDARSQQAVDLLSQWIGQGASRLDRDGDGKVDAPGAAVLDAAFPKVVDAVVRPVLGDLTGSIPGTRNGTVMKDLRTLLGDPVAGAYSRRYCGNGDVAVCRASLWAAVKAAADQLAANQGTDPTAWRSNASRQGFAPGLLPNTIRGVNRPTFQQVVEFDRPVSVR